MLARLTLFALVLFAGGTATAQETPELVTDRPDQTESAVTITPGWVQLEGGVEYIGPNPTFPDADGATLGLLARVGILRGVEVRLDLESGTRREPIMIGTKLRLWNEREAWPAAALLVTTNVDPDAERQVEARLALAKSLNERLSLGSNVGVVYNHPRDLTEVLYTLTLGVSVAERVGVFAEVYGEGEWPGAAGGFTYLVVPNLQLDVAGGHAFRGNGYFVGVGASYRLPR